MDRGTVQEAEERLRLILRDNRSGREVSQKLAAERAGISRPFYLQIENGDRRLSVIYYLEMCRAISPSNWRSLAVNLMKEALDATAEDPA